MPRTPLTWAVDLDAVDLDAVDLGAQPELGGITT
jgi:hypothetical protein